VEHHHQATRHRKVAHENVDTNLGILQAISLARALAGRGEDGGMRSYQLEGRREVLPNGDQVLLPDERANERILSKFREEGPMSPGKSGRPGKAARARSARSRPGGCAARTLGDLRCVYSPECMEG
jgi:hypothetical protein